MPLGKPYKALAINERAIGAAQGRKYVFVVDAQNKVVERPVTLGVLQEHMRVVLDGLTATDRVIVNGLQRVRPGVTVDPQTVEATASTGAGKTVVAN